MPRVARLFIYPVKSLRGIAVDAAEVDALGFAGDRRFLVVDGDGRFVTQRTVPRMAAVATALDAATLTLSAGGAGAVSVPRASDPAAPLRRVTVWGSEGLLAEDCGEEPAAWLTARLGQPVRLVRAGARFERPLKPSRARPGDRVAFADAFPFLAISEASLDRLNDRLAERDEEPVPMDRFRPNLVLSGCDAHAEDQWMRFRIGPVVFRQGGPCARCLVTTTDQMTGERKGPEPLRTLATYRRAADDPSDVNFGANLVHETFTGTIRVGDDVVIGG